MKLIMPCLECTEVDGFKDDTFLFVDIEDGSYYEITCPRGHSQAAILTTRKFEILFEFGAMALLDGYPREAVSSFAVALERFYEFWLKGHLLHAGVTSDELDAAWKQVSAQPERQLGAFSLLYIHEYYTPAPMLPQWVTEFRNKVIHKGYIPTRAEAVSYGDQVLQHMVKLYKELYKSRYAGLSKIEGIELGRAASRATNPKNVSTMNVATVFSEAASDAGTTLEKALGRLESRMARIYQR